MNVLRRRGVITKLHSNQSVSCPCCNREITDNQKWELHGNDYYHKGHFLYDFKEKN